MLGNALGLVVQVLLVALGLGALVAASATLYTVVKVGGAAYVVWLGVQAIRHRSDARAAITQARPVISRGSGRSVLTGLTVGVTNPKTLVFFVAFLPQFIDAGSGHAGVQMAVLGLVFGTLAACSDSLWALAAGRARAWFAHTAERLDGLGMIGGTMMIGLGAAMLASE